MRNSQIELGMKSKRLAAGPFGSAIRTSSGPTSLPIDGLQKRNSKIFKFELESSSSGSSCFSGYKGSEPNLILAFGMEPRRYN